MTPPWRERCWRCGASTEKPFDQWVRRHPLLTSADGFTFNDGDKIAHRYKTKRGRRTDRDVQYLMDVEVKTFAAEPSDTQRDTLLMRNEVVRTINWREHRDDSGRFSNGHPQNARHMKVWSSFLKRKVQAIYYGHHLLVLSHSTPVDSEWMTWDRRSIDVDQLVGVLRFDLNPDTLKPNDFRDHKRRDRTLKLFAWPPTARTGQWDAENDPRTDLFPEFEDGA